MLSLHFLKVVLSKHSAAAAVRRRRLLLLIRKGKIVTVYTNIIQQINLVRNHCKF